MGPELILLAPFVIWIYLKFRQTKMITNISTTMQETGRMYYGQVPGKPKILIIVAVDKSGEILDARLIQLLRIVKPAAAYDLPEIVGKKLDSLVPSKITNDEETRAAMSILIQSYKRDNEDNRDAATIYVQSKRAVQRPNLKK